MIKKILVGVVVAIVALVIVVALALHLFLDSAVKRGVETIGPKMTKVDVKLDGVHISLLGGEGSLKGLVVGNPAGYKTPHAISVGKAGLALKPGSLLGDKIIIKSINIESPEITLEGGLTDNNLKKIQANLNETTSGPRGTNIAGATPKEEKKASRKLEVDDFQITNAKLDAHVTLPGIGSKTLTLTLKPIHLQNLGTGPEGITAPELTKQVLDVIEKQALEAVTSEAGNLGNVVNSLTKGLGTNASGGANKVTKGLEDLFKKKK